MVRCAALSTTSQRQYMAGGCLGRRRHGRLIIMTHISAGQTITLVFRLRKIYQRSMLLRPPSDTVGTAPQGARPRLHVPIPRHPHEVGAILSTINYDPQWAANCHRKFFRLGVALALHSGSTLALAMMWTPLVMA